MPLLLVVFLLLLFQSPAPAQVREVRRVLIINELGLWSPGVAALDKEIFSALEKSPYQIEFYSEDLDTSLFPDQVSQRQFRDWYFYKYRDRKPDLIIAVGPSPIKFMSDSHKMFSPSAPVVFWGSTEEFAEPPRLDSDFTGVWGVAQPSKTLEAALRLQPNTKHVVVVGGVAPYDRHLEGLVKQSFAKYESKLDFTYLTDLAMPELLERLGHLPGNTIVYHTSIMEDAAGAHFIDAIQSIPMVARAANAPVFVVDDVDVGRGTVGGDVFSFALAGQAVGGMAVRLLNGEKAQDIPIVRGANTYLFDWRALRRWGLKESDLPPGSIVLNRQPTLWESYKAYIIGGISLILVEAVLIFGLVWNRARRREAETELATTYERLRLAVEAGKAVGWDWDLKSGRDRWFGDLKTMFGIPSDGYSGHVEDFRRRIHPEDREIVWKAVADAKQGRRPYVAEFRVIREDRAVRWITARGQFHYAANGEADRMLGMAVDITDRKMAEDALANLSGRLIEAQEEERRRIAREIHDDYNQRLAMLAIDLETLAESVEDSSVEAGQRLHQLFNHASELGADLHSLSHRLHSSTLGALGLVAGVKAFCQEFAQQTEVQVDFAHENVPPGIPGDAALCIFRVAQEGLRNVRRHSGASRAEVRLEWSGDGLHLSVSDRGRGFDSHQPPADGGIGIRSMKERLRLLGGRLEIHSRPMEGTRIDAWLPFKIATQRAS